MKRWTPHIVLSLVAGGLAASVLVVRAWGAGIPTAGTFTYTGRLENTDGTPVSGTHPIQLNVWTSDMPSANATPVCTVPSAEITLVAGRFSLPLPSNCVDQVKANANLWTEILVDGVSYGRTKLGAVPYAVEAGHATAADTATAAAGALQTTVTQVQSRLTAVEGFAVGGCMSVTGDCGNGTFNQPTYFLDRVGGSCPDDHPIFRGFKFQRCGTLGTSDEGLQLVMTCCALSHPAAQ
jgi:hypothetical protein